MHAPGSCGASAPEVVSTGPRAASTTGWVVPTKPTVADFVVGQRVRCTEPERFIAEFRNYLRDREGTVDSVSTVYPDRLWITWHQRRGRGKERRELMRPDSLEAVNPPAPQGTAS